jgi:hypothetical protein
MVILATIKIVMLRPVPIWNFVIRAERVIEIEEDIGRHLIARGCAKDQAAYLAEAAKRKERKSAAAKAKEKAINEAVAAISPIVTEAEPAKRKKGAEA